MNHKYLTDLRSGFYSSSTHSNQNYEPIVEAIVTILNRRSRRSVIVLFQEAAQDIHVASIVNALVQPIDESESMPRKLGRKRLVRLELESIVNELEPVNVGLTIIELFRAVHEPPLDQHEFVFVIPMFHLLAQPELVGGKKLAGEVRRHIRMSRPQTISFCLWYDFLRFVEPIPTYERHLQPVFFEGMIK